MAAGAVSLKLPNFLTTSQDVTKGADQAKYTTFFQNICVNILGYSSFGDMNFLIFRLDI